ncbi:hypothetical protein GCM10009555_085280 [Acrocarpospora macrocephala]|uniref:Uncharacterized protein n=1 Tax=Acrocarpospora macrocephala TaxID=150177 RepID=A0A5M3WYR1_9ACTN|nr:hypothetical protein [Acrocarpospora macrocephala]GES13910.1 hypothetical protein Amac_075070 [Acrocarpospora macrocephala]
MIDTERHSPGNEQALLNSIDDLPYATLRGLLEYFVEQPTTTSSGFTNFI